MPPEATIYGIFNPKLTLIDVTQCTLTFP